MGSSVTKARNISNLSAITRWSKVLTSTSTTISGTDNFSASLSYVAGFEQVYFNGVFLTRGTDYTATNGTTVTLTNAPAVGDQVEVLSALPFTPDNTYTQAQSNAAFYQTSVTPVAGKNKIINGDFGIWQRGTSFSAGGFTSDRWLLQVDGSGATRAVTQQAFTPGNPITGYEPSTYLRYNQSVAGTSATFNILDHRIEDVRTLAGQTVTVSFWAKAAATTSIDSSIQQVFGSGGSAEVAGLSSGTFSLTTSWVRYSYTGALASISGKTIGAGSYAALRFNFPRNATFTVDIWGVQVEAGSVATAFTTATGTIQGELAACQRYYWRRTGTFSSVASGFANSTTVAFLNINFPVPMRTAPSAIDTTGTVLLTWQGGGYNTISSYAIGNLDNTGGALQATSSGLTTGYPILLSFSNAGTIGFTAEL